MLTEQDKVIADWAVGGVALATLLGWLPSIAAAVTIAYTLVRLWETKTVRRLLKAVCARCAAWWDK